ncbi:FKBP-type peptidyl-prolyl cis-trans isomerase [archaeon]|nr:FKBP-type peptidyl-prolyl cis-trans isomerase [archaeon]
MKKILVITAMFATSAIAQINVNELNGVNLAGGVVVTHIKVGNGEHPKYDSIVKVEYRGMFKNGQIFDQSTSPIEFNLNQVIPCWTTGVQAMRVSGIAKLDCPSETAYGIRGMNNIIPPNTPLVFEVKLVGFN